MKTFYSIWDGRGIGTMTRLLTDAGYKAVDDPYKADFLIFNGGADIATEIYNELPVMRGIPAQLQPRDEYEISLYKEFLGKKPFLGICRGAQLLNCLAGGTLWQHVNSHQVDHKMIDLRTGDTFYTTSTHHQMMRPTKDAEIIAVARESTRKYASEDTWEHLGKRPVEADDDIEVVFYPKTQALCIQGHPEYVPGGKFAEWSIKLMEEKLAA